MKALSKRGFATVGGALMVIGMTAGASPAAAGRNDDRRGGGWGDGFRNSRCQVELDRDRGDRDKYDLEIDSNRRNGQAFVVVNYDRGDDARATVNLDSRGDFFVEGLVAPDRARRVTVTAWILGSHRVTRCSDTLSFGGGRDRWDDKGDHGRGHDRDGKGDHGRGHDRDGKGDHGRGHR